MLALLVSVFGGLGCAARFGLDSWIRRRIASGFPWSTLAINVTGSLFLAFLIGIGASSLNSLAVPVLGSGFLGGYTTFSTASVEAAVLFRSRQWNSALFYAIGTLVFSSLAAVAGLWIGSIVRVPFL